MKKHLISFCCLLSAWNLVQAQQFIDKALIKYEVKTSQQKMLGSGTWADMMKDNMSQFKTGIYTLQFSGNRSLYKFDHWDESTKTPEWMKKDDEYGIWYADYEKQQFSMQKNLFGNNFVVNDSIQKIQWKLTNENRVIAGFNCRKAVAKVLDSVYIFAFDSEELLLPGGPCTIHGLPGTILGLTIPRLHTSFIATSVKTTGLDDKLLVAPTDKKPFTWKNYQSILLERMKEWMGGDSEDNADERSWISAMFWKALI